MFTTATEECETFLDFMKQQTLNEWMILTAYIFFVYADINSKSTFNCSGTPGTYVDIELLL